MSWKRQLCEAGEQAVTRELAARGWQVINLNQEKSEPNVDLIAKKGNKIHYIQVKTYNDYRWISGGSVNPEVCLGAPIFNRARNARYRCTCVICVTPSGPGDKHEIRDDWRLFIMPVEIANKLFRINVDGYYNTPKLNGEPKSKRGALQDFVGPGPIPITYIPDHHQDYAPFESAWESLE